MNTENENTKRGGEHLALVLAIVSIPLALILFGFIAAIGSLALSWKTAKETGHFSRKNIIAIVLAVIGLSSSIFMAFGIRAMVVKWNALQAKSMAAKGQSIAGFEWTDMDGNLHNRESMGEKVLIVNIWGTWCPPCKREIPHFSKLAVEFGDQVQFIGISQDSLQKLEDFKEGVRVSYPLVSMKIHELPKPLNEVTAYPTTFLIDSNDTIQDVKVGFLREKTLHRWLSPETENGQH